MINPVLGRLDIETVASLAARIWREHYTGIIGEAQVEYMLDRFQSPDAIERQIADEGYLYFLIRDHDRFVGYAAARPDADALFLSKIYVLASHRGRGYARKAVHYLEQLARAKGLERIWLTVNRQNAVALDAYEAMGFVRTGELVQPIGNGYVMDDYRLELKLV